MIQRRNLLAGIVFVMSATFLIAADGTLVTVDGQRLDGDITETRENVTIVRHGVKTVLPRDHVAQIDYASYATRFDAALAALKEDDVAGRITLAREAFDKREYALAQRAVDQALEINPLNREAHEMNRVIGNQLMLEAAKKKPSTRPTTRATTTAADTDPSSTPKRKLRGLSPEQINVVRQMELKSGDQVRVQFRNNARKAFVDSQPGLSFREFNTLTDTGQALAILDKGSDEVKRDVVILSDPSTIQTFGRRLHTAVVQGCATSQCHGGNAAGNFKLLTGTPDASTLVTNFYLLMTYERADANVGVSPFARSVVGMIDRTNADNSLLFQYALPRAKARHKHPEVRNWDGMFVGPTDRIAVDLLRWIGTELAPVEPDYGFSFSLLPSTKPADSVPAESTSSAETTGEVQADAETASTDAENATTEPTSRPSESTEPQSTPADAAPAME